MGSWKPPWSALLEETFGLFTLFGKGREQGVEIGSGSSLALLLPEYAKQISHGSAFVHKAAEVALRASRHLLDRLIRKLALDDHQGTHDRLSSSRYRCLFSLFQKLIHSL